MPSIVWYPFAIILFTQGTVAIIFVMIMGGAPAIAKGLITGVDYTPPLLLRAGRTMGLRGLTLYRYLIVPASLPAFVAGLKQGWAFAWRSLVAGELIVAIVGPPSLGVLLNTYESLSDFAQVISITIVFLIPGILVDMIFPRSTWRSVVGGACWTPRARTDEPRRGLAGQCTPWRYTPSRLPAGSRSAPDSGWSATVTRSCRRDPPSCSAASRVAATSATPQ
jgi:hypothetical protein